MRVDVIPKPVLQTFVAMLNDDAEAMSRWHSESCSAPLRRVACALQAVLDNPRNIWVSVTECARHLQKSEETIRRWCRDGTANFQFHKQENGEYAIWLPDVLKGDE